MSSESSRWKLSNFTPLMCLQILAHSQIELDINTVGHAFAPQVRKGFSPRTVEVIKTEEKGSDVNLASYLLLDAFRKDCEIAVVISNDSDLRTPIIIAEQEFGIKVGVINPQSAKHRSRALTATFFKQLRPTVVASCQLPNVMNDADGEFRKPSTW